MKFTIIAKILELFDYFLTKNSVKNAKDIQCSTKDFLEYGPNEDKKSFGEIFYLTAQQLHNMLTLRRVQAQYGTMRSLQNSRKALKRRKTEINYESSLNCH